MSEWAAKNEARKQGRANGTVQERREARRLRRLVLGAFGSLPSSGWNDRVPGTTGARK